MAKDGSTIEMILMTTQGHVSSTEWLDGATARRIFEIERYCLRSPGEILTHSFRYWLRSGEGQRALAIVEGKRDIELNGGHDFDDVIAELEAIVRGDDVGGDG